MGNEKKTEAKSDKVRGKAKEAVGKTTGDDELKNQGKRDQSKGDLKQAGEKAKDAFKR